MRPVIISATQIDNFKGCPLKWGFKKGAIRLPERLEINNPRVLGNVLHEVCERFLRADRLAKVNLYPKGWKSTISKFGADKGRKQTVTDKEAALIKQLVTAAITEGVLVRSPGGQVEKRVHFPVLQTKDHGNVFLMGFIDYVPDKWVIEDHKTMKKNKSPWRKTTKHLETKDVQAKVYAKALLVEAEANGEPLPETIRFTHNQFSKDPDDPAVGKTSAILKRVDVEEWWEAKVLPMAAEMARLKHETDWKKFPGPAEGSNACAAYGGCEFTKICTGVNSIKRFIKKAERHNLMVESALDQTTTKNPPLPTAEGTHQMNFKERMAARKKKNTKGATKGAATAKKTTKKKATKKAPAPAAAADEDENDIPPWANPDCRACGGTGFSSKGGGCRICDSKAKTQGRPRSSDYELDHDEGMVVWVNREDSDDCGSAQIGPAKVKVTAEKEPEAPGEEEAEEEGTETEEEVVEEEVVEEETPAPAAKSTSAPKEKKGRKKAGPKLFIDCYPTVGGGTKPVLLAVLVTETLDTVAAAGEVDHWTDLDTWKRREMLDQMGEAVAEDLGTKSVICTLGGLPEAEVLLDALSRYASLIVRG